MGGRRRRRGGGAGRIARQGSGPGRGPGLQRNAACVRARHNVITAFNPITQVGQEAGLGRAGSGGGPSGWCLSCGLWKGLAVVFTCICTTCAVVLARCPIGAMSNRPCRRWCGARCGWGASGRSSIMCGCRRRPSPCPGAAPCSPMCRWTGAASGPWQVGSSRGWLAQPARQGSGAECSGSSAALLRLPLAPHRTLPGSQCAPAGSSPHPPLALLPMCCSAGAAGAAQGDGGRGSGDGHCSHGAVRVPRGVQHTRRGLGRPAAGSWRRPPGRAHQPGLGVRRARRRGGPGGDGVVAGSYGGALPLGSSRPSPLAARLVWLCIPRLTHSCSLSWPAAPPVQRLARLPMRRLVPKGFVFIFVEKQHVQALCRQVRQSAGWPTVVWRTASAFAPAAMCQPPPPSTPAHMHALQLIALLPVHSLFSFFLPRSCRCAPGVTATLRT